MYRAAVPLVRCHAGTSKRDLAREAAAGGAALVLVDDGFSHWALARDADVVLLDFNWTSRRRPAPAQGRPAASPCELA